MAGPWEAYQERGPWDAYREQEPLAPKKQEFAAIRHLFPPQLGGQLAPDIIMGGAEVVGSAAQMATRGAETLANKFGGSPMITGARKATEGALQAVKDEYDTRYAPDASTGSSLARGVGQAVMTMPLLPAIAAGGLVKSVAQGAGLGAGASALTPVYNAGDDFWKKKGEQIVPGLIAGGALGGAGSLVSKVISPNIGAAEKALLAKDVRLTPGQTMGGITKGIEDRLAGFPLIGDVINAGRRMSIKDFNRALYAKAVEQFGDDGAKVVKSSKIGHDGIRRVGDFLSSKYEAALAKSGPAVLDDAFRDNVVKVHQMVPGAMQKDFAKIVNDAIKVTPENTITPSVAKSAESAIGARAAGYKASSLESERQLGYALEEVKSELRALFAKANPEQRALIDAADHGWRTLVQIEKAGSMLGAKGGVFTPAQFLNAVKNTSKSVRGRQFARGDAWNQRFAEQADSVLPNTVPDSGTMGRASLALAMMRPDLGLAAGLAAAPYLPGLRQITTAALTRRPEMAQPISAAVRQSAPYLGLLSGGLLSTGQ